MDWECDKNSGFIVTHYAEFDYKKVNGYKKQWEGTVGGTKGYLCEKKFSWKCRK